MLYTCRTNSAVCNKIHELADNKQFKDIKEAAYYWTTNWYVENNSLIEKLIQLVPGKDMTVAMVTRGVMTTTFFFEGCRGDALKTLNAIEPRKKGKTAHKVLVKMIFTRLRTLQGQIEILKATNTKSPRRTILVASIPYTIPNLTREDLTPANLKMACQGSTPHIREAMANLIKILERDDMTSEVISEAWDLLRTSLVMDT